MSNNLDLPPIYDPITANSKDFMNGIWMSWITTFSQSVIEYLSEFGIFIPRLTTDQRNKIQSPTEGQIIYNTTIIGPQIWRGGIWQTFTTSP
ncbi:MAG TPA: hypothetical protein VNF93_02310 [Buchnera sp. (in: enterobacteria)]|nr:hypothetical protein [Buchnera sp. (in: enterobacteria)]